MKRIIIYTCMALAICAAALSCTRDFVEINTNPNKMNYGTAPATSLYEPLLYGMAAQQQYQAWFFAHELVQVTAFTSGQTTQIHQYQLTDGNWQGQWDNFARYGFDAHHLVDQAIKDGDKYMEALGLILKVYCLSNLTALFGDIPYTEAYQLSANTSPVFESQEAVAGHLVADLDSAAVILARKPAVTKASLDRMYLNSYSRWIKFANSLKLRILCRMSGISDSYWDAIQAIVDDPAKYPVFTENADNASVPFADADPYRSYWGQQNMEKSSFTNHRLTQTMIDMMVEFNASGNAVFEDPRLLIYATQRSGKWKGSRGGIPYNEYSTHDSGSALPNYETICRAAMPAFLMDYSEVLFILAEGVEKGKLTLPGQTAKSLYEAAVRASIEKWAEFGQYASKPVIVRKADVETLLSGYLGSYDKAASVLETDSLYGSALELIACQKFLSLYFCGYEVFHEWRRTEYPDFQIADGTSANNYEVPTRYGYPNYTVASNSAHVQQAITRMGGTANNMHIPMDWSYVKLNGAHRSPHPLQQ